MDNTSQKSPRGDWLAACTVILFRQGSREVAWLQTYKDVATRYSGHSTEFLCSAPQGAKQSGGSGSPDSFKHPPPSANIEIILSGWRTYLPIVKRFCITC